MDQDDRTGNRVPPPAVYALGFLVGWGLDALVGLSAVPPLGPRLFWGILLVGAALLLDGWALLTFRRARTTWSPMGGSTVMVDEGPYARTRNPMYVGLTILYVGLAFLVGRVGPLLTLPLVILYMDRVLVPREEAYLERKFGGHYLAYKRRVRRWG